MGFVLIFDLPRESGSLRRQLNRRLNSLGAKQIQFSVWVHDKLDEFVDIANWIKKSGGEARILEEKFIF